MNRPSTLLVAALAALTLLAASTAEAARLGGGRSAGMQRAAPPAASRTAPGPAADPVMPRPSTAAPATAAAAPAAAAAARPRSSWLGPIAGIAAGLGIAALMSHLGLAPAMGDLLVLLLLAAGAFLLFRMFVSRRTPAPAGAAAAAPPAWSREAPRTAPPVAPTASTATFGRSASRFPPGFDADGFARQALAQFRALQAAWDRGDRAALAAVMTPALHAEITGTMKDGGWSVVNVGSVFPLLDAEVVDVATEGTEHWASVRFHGTVREDGSPTPEPFDEQWNLVKPVDGSSGWLLAGIQQTASAL